MGVSTLLRITGTKHIYELVDNSDANPQLDQTTPSRFTFNRGESLSGQTLTVTYTYPRGYKGVRHALLRFRLFIRQGEKT